MPATQLLYQTAIDSLSNGARVAIVNACDNPLLRAIKKGSVALGLTQHFKPEYDALVRSGFNCSESLEGEFDLILVIPAKNKQQTLGWMGEAMNHLVDSGKLLMACANSHGAKSYASAMEKLAGNASSSSKSKCRIFSARKGDGFDRELAATWFQDAEPRVVERHGLLSQPGLFSWEKPDIGSQLLLHHLPDSLSGTGMDLCCGYGYLSAHLLENHADIESLYLIEADRLALACAVQNSSKWQQKIQSHWLDAAAGPLPLKLDWIVCNPPFHTGQDRDVELGQAIIANACKSLKRAGKLYMVANRKLPYEETLDRMLMQHRCIVQEQGFKIIEATKGAGRKTERRVKTEPDELDGWDFNYEQE